MEEKINAVIVDDESLARESLRHALQSFSDIHIAAECVNGFEAVQAVQEHRPHLLFLDVRMPKLDGFDVVELLGKDSPIIIFVTSFDEYALKAFEAEALDYILKPVQTKRLEKALNRVRKQFHAKQKKDFEGLIEKHQDTMSPVNRVLIRSGYDVTVVPVGNIRYIEAQDDYVKIHTKDGKSFLKSERMGRLEEMLDRRYFCRIHRSYIINIDSLKKIEPYTKDSRLALLQDGTRLNISRSGYSRLMELM